MYVLRCSEGKLTWLGLASILKALCMCPNNESRDKSIHGSEQGLSSVHLVSYQCSIKLSLKATTVTVTNQHYFHNHAAHFEARSPSMLTMTDD